MEAFAHIQGCINIIYKELTKSQKHPDGGSAQLHLDDAENPFAGARASPPPRHFPARTLNGAGRRAHTRPGRVRYPVHRDPADEAVP